eukprot:1147044-Pelagomonas_calceolata.AAC.2
MAHAGWCACCKQSVHANSWQSTLQKCTRKTYQYDAHGIHHQLHGTGHFRNTPDTCTRATYQHDTRGRAHAPPAGWHWPFHSAPDTCTRATYQHDVQWCVHAPPAGWHWSF